MSHTQGSWAAILLALIATILISWTTPSRLATPQGIVLPTQGNLRAPILPNQVNVFDTNSAPNSYRTLGQITVQLHTTDPSSDNEDTVLDYAKQLAAQAGGNGLILTGGGYTADAPAALAMQVVIGLVVLTSHP